MVWATESYRYWLNFNQLYSDEWKVWDELNTYKLDSTRILLENVKGGDHFIVKVQIAPYNLPWRHRGRVEILLYSFSNLGITWGWWLTPRPDRFILVYDPVPIVREVGWAPGPVWTCAENLAPTKIRSLIVQPVASRYIDWAVQAHPLHCFSFYMVGIVYYLKWNMGK